MGQREEISSREELLKKIRQSMLVARENPHEDIDISTDVFHRENGYPDLIFAEEFIQHGGKFIFCESVEEMKNQLYSLIDQKQWKEFRLFDSKLLNGIEFPESLIITPESATGEEISISRCEYLAIRTGSIIISTAVTADNLAWSYCSIHIVIASTKQLVPDVATAYKKITDKYKDNQPALVSVITGPSRTADIEKQLVIGAHGPKELYLFLVDEE